MANEPVAGSTVIAAVKPNLDANGQLVPSRLVADDSYSPARLIVELPDRALRDLGTATVDGVVDSGLPDVYTQAIDYDASSHVIYQGWAAPGSGKAAALWAITKLSYTGDNVTDIQWAGGAATFANVWNNRAGLSYS